MRLSLMEAARNRLTRFRVAVVATTCLTLALAVTAGAVTPSVGLASSQPPITSTAAAYRIDSAGPTLPSALAAADIWPAMCRPEPPDYPGCTPQQVRPLLLGLFRAQYTGHAYGYRYYRMGQHPRGVIFAHLLPVLNAHLARLYRQAVQRYAVEHTSVTVDNEGQRHVVVSYPRYRTWAGLRDNATSFCVINDVTRRFPAKYCAGITLMGQLGALINNILHDTVSILFSCSGNAIGGWSSGSFIAWRLGTGMLRGGFYGGVGAEMACQTKNLWDWATRVW